MAGSVAIATVAAAAAETSMLVVSLMDSSHNFYGRRELWQPLARMSKGGLLGVRRARCFRIDLLKNRTNVTGARADT
jgi:hypothetical protein